MSRRITRPVRSFDAVPERVVEAAKQAFRARALTYHASWPARRAVGAGRTDAPGRVVAQ
jgi:hypothetical protein